MASLQAEIVKPARVPLLLACAAAAVTLVIALANLVTLALLRLTERPTELAIREALGAGALRLRRQLLTEHLLTVAAGGMAGFAFATYLTRALTASEAAHLPRPEAIHFDQPVRIFAAALTAFMAIVLTVLPFRSGAGGETLRDGGRTAGRAGRRLRQALVGAELALALALSVGGALLGLSLIRLFETDPGFTPSGTMAVRVSAYQARYPSLDDVEAFTSSIISRVESMPGVAVAGAGSSLPLSGQMTGTGVVAEGQPVRDGARQQAGWQFVTPGYFQALGMPIRRGRDLTGADRRHAGHVTVINESLARALFGDDDPVGRRITTGDASAGGDWHEIVGVVGDVRHDALDAPAAPRMYDLFGEHWGRTFYVVVRSRAADAAPLIPSVRRAVAELDSEAPVFETATVDTLVKRSAAPYRLAAMLAGGLALTSVLLALIGVYTVAAGSVAERRREIRVRAALGAAPRDLLRMVLREGVLVSAAAGTAGLAASYVIVQLLGSPLFGVHTSDLALVIPSVALLVLLVALAAVYPAARRASRADPLVAMRVE